MFQELNKKEKTNKGRITMRRSIYLFALLTLFVVGCSEQSSVIAPVNNVNTNEPNWIALPKAEGMQVNTVVSNSKIIDGTKGGIIALNNMYHSSTGDVVIKSDLRFPDRSFSGQVKFTVSHDDATCLSTYGPSYVFNKALIFNITYTGVDLSTVNPLTVKFAYISTKNSVEYAVNDGIVVDKTTGTLQVINAQIPHFSRYGFVN